MTLARMINADENALICDFAETYHIYDYESLPVMLAATLSSGLGVDSRIRKIISGTKYTQQELLLARISDGITGILWKLGAYGNADQPPSLLDVMINGMPEKPKGDYLVFRTSEDFDAAWNG